MLSFNHIVLYALRANQLSNHREHGAKNIVFHIFTEQQFLSCALILV